MPSETRLAFQTAFSRSDHFRCTCSKSGISLEIRFRRQTAARNRYAVRTAHGFENPADYPSVLKALML
ncbi:hypothetical protein DRA70_07790 [Neisseria meningitidis]|nr:hypothetical protein DRA70_07790 [Neisseria meningitidis]